MGKSLPICALYGCCISDRYLDFIKVVVVLFKCTVFYQLYMRFIGI